MILSLLLAVLGPHAADAQAHALDPAATWVGDTRMRVFPSAPSPVPLVTRRVYGYLPYWESINLDTFRWDLITDVIAFSVDIGADGTLSNTHGLPGSALVSTAHAHGVTVHLCATLFNSSGGSEISTFLGNASGRAKAVQQLVALQPDGLNLDFEFVPSGSRAQFTAFVQQLKSAMQGGELTIAMPSSTSYTGYDAAALAATTDRLLLMEYDYHWRTAPTSGANSPLGSVENAVGTFLAVVGAARLAMGVPYYGYDWPTATGNAGASTSGAGTSVLFGSVFDKFTSYGRIWDSASQTPWYRYVSGTQNHQGWVDDGQSLALKYAFVNSKNLGGIMIWALGYDGARTESWKAIEDAFVPPTPDAGAPDAGTPDEPPAAQVRGCSHAGLAPLWTLFAMLALAKWRLSYTSAHRRTRCGPSSAAAVNS